MKDNEERLTDLELRLMDQQAALEELTRHSLAQEKTIQTLSAQVDQLTNSLRDVRERLPDDERPPHY